MIAACVLTIAACSRGEVAERVDSAGVTPPVAIAQIDSGAPKLLPRDEANASFREFRTQLLAALSSKDTAFLYGILAPEIRTSFGDDGGIAGFKRQWHMDDPETPLWTALSRALNMGGKQSSDTTFVAPYVYAFWPDSLDAFEHVAVTGSAANLHQQPLAEARVLGTVDHSILRVREWRGLASSGVAADSTWASVQLPSGASGWIRGADVYSPVGWRAMFVRHGDRWTMVFFVAGDQVANYVVLLRAISNVPMEPFRKAMAEELGFDEVETYGTSGSILFKAPQTPISTLEKRISERFRTDAFVRSAAEVTKIAANDPLGSTILFLAKPPALTHRESFDQLDFEGRRPVLRGATVYLRYPARLRGAKAPFDFEEFLGVRGTTRSARVVKTIAEKLRDRAS